MTKSIDEILELEQSKSNNNTLPEIIVEHPKEVLNNTDSVNLPAVIEKTNENEDDDAEFVRNNLKKFLITGTKSLEQLSNFASTGESARTYEVVATMIKALTDTSMQLMQVHKSKAETKRLKDNRSSDPNSETTSTTNTQQNITVESAVFVGTSAELLTHIKETKAAEKLKLLDNDDNRPKSE